MPARLDYVRFKVGDDELEVAFNIALELAERATRAPDDAARSVGARIRGAGASRSISLSPTELAALARVIDEWDGDAATVRRLRDRLPEG